MVLIIMILSNQVSPYVAFEIRKNAVERTTYNIDQVVRHALSF